MAGSLNHITAEDGSFTMDTIENLGDAWEALQECHQIIAWLLPLAGRAIDGCDATCTLAEACYQLGFPESATPILDTKLIGLNGALRGNIQ